MNMTMNYLSYVRMVFICLVLFFTLQKYKTNRINKTFFNYLCFCISDAELMQKNPTKKLLVVSYETPNSKQSSSMLQFCFNL